MNINTWVNLVGASVIAVGGLASNANVFIVASMLVSPIMGPILGMTFGYRIADWQLFKTGVVNEFKMSVVAFLVGAICGLIIGMVGKTYGWPTSAMQTDGQAFSLIVSVLVSAAVGAVLAGHPAFSLTSLTATSDNHLRRHQLAGRNGHIRRLTASAGQRGDAHGLRRRLRQAVQPVPLLRDGRLRAGLLLLPRHHHLRRRQRGNESLQSSSTA